MFTELIRTQSNVGQQFSMLPLGRLVMRNESQLPNAYVILCFIVVISRLTNMPLVIFLYSIVSERYIV